MKEWIPNEEKLLAWRRDGVLKLPSLLSSTESFELYQYIHQIFLTPESQHFLSDPLNLMLERGLLIIDNAHWSSGLIRTLCLNPILGKIAANLMSTPIVRVWASQILCKAPNSPSVIGWHQDFNYWQCLSAPKAVTAWIALHDINQESGGLIYLPGSHLNGLLNIDGFCSRDRSLQLKQLPEQLACLEPIAYDMAVGEIAFHHCLTLHSSGPNTLSIPRLAIAISYIATDCNYESMSAGNNHINVVAMKACGRKRFDGPLFPSVPADEVDF